MNNKLLSGALAALTLIGGTAAFGAAANAAPADFGHRHGGYVQDHRFDRSDVRRDRAEFRYRRDLRHFRRDWRHHRHDLHSSRSERFGRW